MSKLWTECDREIDELDREYYRAKLEELSWCLPVVRAAKAWKAGWVHPLNPASDPGDWALWKAVEAMELAEAKR